MARADVASDTAKTRRVAFKIVLRRLTANRKREALKHTRKFMRPNPVCPTRRREAASRAQPGRARLMPGNRCRPGKIRRYLRISTEEPHHVTLNIRPSHSAAIVV